MAQTFFPIKGKQKYIQASPPHQDAQYVVSIGSEMWGGIPQSVIKVQMAYNGKISGRRSPSYPIGTNDYQRVHDAIIELLSE